jgi:hypothetical protein
MIVLINFDCKRSLLFSIKKLYKNDTCTISTIHVLVCIFQIRRSSGALEDFKDQKFEKLYLKFLKDGESISFDTSRIIGIGGEGIVLYSGDYKYDPKEDRTGYSPDKAKMKGKPSCTKYTFAKKFTNYSFHYFNPEIVSKERRPPESTSANFKSTSIISNLETYFCKLNNDILIGTGKSFNKRTQLLYFNLER